MSKNRKLGLVLGAGAGRGFAHIGVLQALIENGIDIDVITGCSMGALVGALYASGTNIYMLGKYAQRFEMKKYFDVSIKSAGFVRGRKIEDLLRLLTRNSSIEQASIPFACVAVNICSGEIMTFKSGPIHKAVRASISMPGIFTPYEIGGEVYVDGGVLERLPIRAARELGADVTLAIDVSCRGQRKEPPKSLPATLQATLDITNWYISSRNEKNADMLVVPDVFEIDPFSAKQAGLSIERGREAMQAHMAELKEMLHIK